MTHLHARLAIIGLGVLLAFAGLLLLANGLLRHLDAREHASEELASNVFYELIELRRKGSVTRDAVCDSLRGQLSDRQEVGVTLSADFLAVSIPGLDGRVFTDDDDLVVYNFETKKVSKGKGDPLQLLRQHGEDRATSALLREVLTAAPPAK